MVALWEESVGSVAEVEGLVEFQYVGAKGEVCRFSFAEGQYLLQNLGSCKSAQLDHLRSLFSLPKYTEWVSSFSRKYEINFVFNGYFCHEVIFVLKFTKKTYEFRLS